MDNGNGRKWARFWLVVALLVSTIANVTHAVLADSEITLWLRVPGAMIWPIFTFAGIEILVRMIWERRASHSVTRWVLISAAVPAAITSYEHQYSLLGMMGETQLIQFIGPIAVDGFMIGCTMALLFTRKLTTSAPMVMEPKTRDEIELTDEQINDQLSVYSLADLTSPAPVSPAPMGTALHSAIEEHVQRERKTRASNGQTAEQVRTMLEDPELKPATSTMRRYASIARALRHNPSADVSEVKGVRPEIVEQIIRPWAMSERVR